MPTHQKQIEQFERELSRLLNGSLNVDDVIARGIITELRAVRRQIAAAMVGSEFNFFSLPAIQGDIDRIMLQFSERQSFVLGEKIFDAFDMGIDIVDKPLIAGGAALQISSLSTIPLAAVDAQVLRGTQFITNLSTGAANQINSIILTSVMGEMTPHQAMLRIGNIGIESTPFNSIGHRAEAIVRTEVNAALNMGTIKRMEQASVQIPGMKKYWIHTLDSRTRASHRAIGSKTNPGLGGKPISIKKDFLVRGPRGMERAKGPGDPRLSAANSVHERCRLGYITPELDGRKLNQ